MLDSKVCGFDVPMHDTLVMKKCNAFKTLPEELDSVLKLDPCCEERSKGSLSEGQEKVYPLRRVAHVVPRFPTFIENIEQFG